MKQTRNIAITVFSITATILAVLLVLGSNTDRGYADVSTWAGDYIMFTGQVTGSNDLLYVIDRTTHTLNTYEFKPADNLLRLVDRVNLAKEFRATTR